MAYTDIDKSTEYFNTKLYTGNGSTQSITGVGFQPDWVWTKERSGVCDHHIFDVLRGATYKINSASTESSSADANTLTSFDSDGFSVGTNACQNNNTDTYVSWNWKANGSGSSNTDGSITSTVSASTTSGFSIVTYTGTGANATIGHGLGVTPSAVFYKSLSTGNWFVYHKSIPATKHIVLNSTNAEATSSTIFNDTAPTSSLLTIGNYSEINGSGNSHIAYCFAEKKGFSKFMSWSGSGSTDGTFLYTGFKPAFFMYKVTSGAGSWGMLDNKRDTFNPVDNTLYAHDSSAEASDHDVDFCSNGLKIRSAGGDINASGSSYIGMAFAEAPLVSSNGVPAVAR